MFELALGIGIAIIVIAFLAEYMDSTLGMGYGTTLTPLLLIMGFDPLQIVPAVLLSELATGLLAGFTHHSIGNVDFRPSTMNIFRIRKAIKTIGFKESWKRGIPQALKVTLVIAACSILGTVAAVAIAISLPKFYLKLYIGVLILAVGLVTLLTMNKRYGFSWKKITFLGVLASFNKGMSGGGYGPVVTGGQLLSGVDGKNAVAITSLAEGLTCIVGVVTYLATKATIDWSLAPYLMIGAIASVPVSALTVRKLNTRLLKYCIGFLTVGLGIWTIVNLF